jgi:hypothetical protein
VIAPPPAPASNRPLHWPSLWQFALTSLAILTSLGLAFFLAIFGLAMLLSPGSGAGNIEPLQMLLLAVSMLAACVLLLPSALYSLRRLAGKPAPAFPTIIHKLRPGLWILLFPVVLGIGQAGFWLAPSLSWLFLPPLHVLAVVIPVTWMLYLAVRKLPLGSPQRAWGALGSGLGLASTLILITEGCVALVFFVLVVIYLVTQPELVQRLSFMVQELQITQPTPEMALDTLGPYLFKPGVILSVLLYVAGFVPLIEEFLKPAGVWLLMGHKISPQAGFAAGALSGAGYALFESLLLTSNSQGWAAMMVGRVGTSIVHILTTALTGWALVQAWQKRRYLRLLIMYVLAVAIHSMWNGLTVLTAFTALSKMVSSSVQTPAYLEAGIGAPFALVFLAGSLFVLLLIANRELARSLPPSQKPVGLAQPVLQIPAEPGIPDPSATSAEFEIQKNNINGDSANHDRVDQVPD